MQNCDMCAINIRLTLLLSELFFRAHLLEIRMFSLIGIVFQTVFFVRAIASILLDGYVPGRLRWDERWVIEIYAMENYTSPLSFLRVRWLHPVHQLLFY